MLRSVAVLLALSAVSALLVGCQFSGSTALTVGDCINYENSDEGENTVRVDCAQPHDEEVFSVFSYPNAPSAFPGYEAIGAVQQERCQADFATYVGIAWEESAYSIGIAAAPTETSWAAGDRTIVCSLEDGMGHPLTGSAKNTAR